MRVSNPYGDASREPHEVKGHVVVLGIVLGVVATFVWMFAVFILVLGVADATKGPPDWLVFVLFFLPLPLSVLLLVFRRTRQAAAGFVMGLAIGVLVLAGLCSGMVVLPGLGA